MPSLLYLQIHVAGEYSENVGATIMGSVAISSILVLERLRLESACTHLTL